MAAIEKGYIQREIVESAYKHQKEVENKDKIIVGVNDFITEEEVPIKILRIHPSVEKRQVERLKAVKKRRNNEKVENILSDLKRVAESDKNLIPVIFQAVKECASLGDICDALREVFGEYKAPAIF